MSLEQINDESGYASEEVVQAVANRIRNNESRHKDGYASTDDVQNVSRRIAGTQDGVSIRHIDDLPDITNPQFMEDRYSGFQKRLYFNSLDPYEKIRFTDAATRGDKSALKKVAQQIIDRERESLSFPEADTNQLTSDLIGYKADGKTIQYLQPHFKAMLSTATGKQFLKDTWTAKRLTELDGADSRLLADYKTRKLDGDDAVTLANYKRGISDRFGGPKEFIENAVSDLVTSTASTTFSAFGGILQLFADTSHVTPELASQITSTTQDHAIIGDDMRKGVQDYQMSEQYFGAQPLDNTTAYQQVDQWRQYVNKQYLYTPQTGGVFQKIVQGIGSTGTSIAAWFINPMLGVASSYGMGYAEMRGSMPDVDHDKRTIIAALGAIVYTALDYIGFEAITKPWKASSPSGKWFRDSFAMPFMAEFTNESGQQLTNEVGVEVNESVKPGYEFSLPRFLARAVPNSMEAGFYGGLVGAIMGGAGSHPVQTFIKDRQWRAGQQFIDSSVNALKNLNIWKTNPEQGRVITERIIKDAKAPRTMFQAAEEVLTLFQGNINGLRDYLNSVDVTKHEFEQAVISGSDIEISTAGLIHYQSKRNANTDVKQLAKPAPDAPNIGILAERERTKAEMIEEYNRLQEANEPLPEPFRVLREQLMDAGYDAKGASDSADMLLAASKTIGRMLNITAEQVLNLKPIQVVLANARNNVRNAADISTDLESRAAEREYIRYQADRKGRYDFMPAPDGSIDYGVLDVDALIPELLRNAGMESGPVRLERGNRHFGKTHIEDLHQDVLKSIGVSTAEEAVSFVMKNLVQIRKADKGRFRLVAKGEDSNTLVINLTKGGDGTYYTVTTATVYKAGRNIPGEVIWNGSVGQYQNSGDSGPVSYRGTIDTGETTTLRSEGQITPPINTIPADPESVKSWAAESLATLRKESGLTGDRLDVFTQYAQNLIDQGSPDLDAGKMAGDVETAVEYAEGLEQAAAGIERVLAKPEEITQAVLDFAGIDAATIQEGIAALREKAAEFRNQADSWRNFHQTSQGVEAVRNQSITNQGERGHTAFMPHAAAVRLFNSRQDRSTFIHEGFHYFHNLWADAIKTGKADEQSIRDYKTLNDAVGGKLESADPEAKRDGEEMAARLWEQWLMEGKAPSPQLTGAFSRFRRWFTGLYQNIRDYVGTDLTDDVRGVFERLLAGEAEINMARDFYNEKDLLAVTDAIPVKDRQELRNRAERVRQTTEEKYLSRIVKEHINALGGRKEFRRRAKAEVAEQRPYQAAQAVKGMGGISRADVEEIVGAAQADRIAKNHPGVIRENTKDSGGPVDLAALAVEFKYANQREMIEDVVNTARMDAAERRRMATLRADGVIDAARTRGGLDELYVLQEFGTEAVQAVRDVWGDGAFERARGKMGAVTIAERMEYDSLNGMLLDIADAVSAKEAENIRYDQMIAMESERIRDFSREDAATPLDDAYHNDAYSEYLDYKQKVMDDEANRQAEREGKRASRMVSAMAIREAARENISRMPERKAVQTHIFANDFKRHGKNAMDAERKGDFVTAAKELRMQRMAHYSMKEAIDAGRRMRIFEKRNQPAKVIARLEGKGGTATEAHVEHRYRELIKHYLTAFKVTDSIRLAPETSYDPDTAVPGYEPNSEMETFLPSLAESIPAWIRNLEGADKLKSWKDLTYGQVIELDETIKGLERLGAGTLEAMAYGKAKTISEMVADSISRMGARDSRRAHTYDADKWINRVANWFDTFGTGAFLPEYVLAMADGNTGLQGQGVGPLQNMALTFRDRLGKKSDIARDATQKITPAIKTLQGYRKRFAKEVDLSRIPVPENIRIGRDKQAWTPEMAIMTALNSGNAGNLKAFLDGYGLTEAQWQSIIGTFTAAELDAIQTIWDTIGGFYPAIDEVTFRLVNKHVKKEAALPFTVTTADGVEKTMNGGYFPLVYDAMADPEFGGNNEIAVNLRKAYANSIHGHTRISPGALQSRKTDSEGNPVVKHPPLLDLSILFNHVGMMSHYIAMADAVHESDRFTSDDGFSRVFKDKFGVRYYNMIRQYIKDMADPDAKRVESGTLRSSMEWLRHKAVTGALALNPVSALKQLPDFFPAALHMSLHSRTGKSGFKYLLGGVKDYVSGKVMTIDGREVKARDFIFEKSQVMRDRDGNVTADMREMRSKVTGDKTVVSVFGKDFTWNDVHDGLFLPIQTADRFGAGSAWLGQYRMSMDGNGSFDPTGMTAKEMETAAIRDADMAAATFASSTLADQTAWQRDKGFARMFTTFMTGTVRRTSRARQYVDALQNGQMTKARFVQAVFMDLAMPVYTVAAASALLKAFAGDDDDDKSIWDWFSLIFVDPVMTVVDGVPGFNAINSAREYGARGAFTPAALGFAEKNVGRGLSIPENIKKEEYGEAAYKAALIGTAATGVPLEGVVRTLKKFGVIEKDGKKGK